MLTKLTCLSAKDVQFLQPHRSLRWCERQLNAAKGAVGANVALVKHLAEYWGLQDEDIIAELRPRFGV